MSHIYFIRAINSCAFAASETTVDETELGFENKPLGMDGLIKVFDFYRLKGQLKHCTAEK